MDFQNPATLGDIFNMNPGAFTQAQGILGSMGQSNDLGMQERQRQMAFNQQADPFRLEQMRLNNQTQEAHLPGIQAQSAMQTRKNSNEALFNEDWLKEQKGKYSSTALKRHIDDFENVGQLLRQSADMVYDSPMGAGYQVKQKLKEAGVLDQVWTPQMDQMPAAMLSKVLADLGNNIGDASTKYRNSLGLINAKGEISKDVADIGATSRERVAVTRAAALAAAQQAKAVQTPKTLEAAFTAALQHAQTATDPQEKAAFTEIARQFQQQYEAALKIKGAGAPGGIDTGAVAGLPTKPPVNLPPIGGTAPPGAPGPLPVAPNAPVTQSAPPGRVLMRNVRTGQVGHVPQAQMEEAMKSGFEPVR